MAERPVPPESSDLQLEARPTTDGVQIANDAERELIAAAAAGNMGAFAQLVAAHRARVLQVAYGVLGSGQEAEDVAQEVFIKAWRNLPHYHLRGSLASWLYRITVNTAIDVLRKSRDERALDEQHAALQGRERTSSAPASPETMVLRQDEQQRVREAVAALPTNARVTLILREYEQLSYKEIAEALDIPIGTVMSRLHYARNWLRQYLADMEGDADAQT
ncbi:MAG: sigma-70 family RNA polymerase sigma factor [Chloroflexi bacterium]|nr:sigma-70 family RNA polymerase sigma factor [Chloroflexota bacterium]